MSPPPPSVPECPPPPPPPPPPGQYPSIHPLHIIHLNSSKRQERHPLIFQYDNTEPYNQTFSIDELRTVLGKAHDTAPGLDQIHNQILKHLPEASLQCLLNVLDNIWETGEFPPSWREATVIPIAKSGKDSKDTNNYCPIALTSCVCKTMER